MFSPTLTQHAPPAMALVEGGGRLHGLIHAFESRVHLLGLYAYQLICEVSPLPFGWTVFLAAFAYITVRQFVLWYQLDLKRETKNYVYWHMSDLINVEYTESYKPEHHLNTALVVYITQKLWRDKPLTALELKNKTFTIHLLSLHSKSIDAKMEECYSDEDLDFRDHEELMVPVKLPIYPCWTPVHEGDVEVCTWISTTRIKNCYPEARRFVYLRARKDGTSHGGANADAALRTFVDNAVGFYFANGYADRDDYSLRMYRVSPSNGRIAVSAAPLPMAPTLNTVFFPQREAVRLQLQRFAEMQGRYAINGFPHKLGFLLYGPRGTGKRSFVRALAYHTKRHIVRIPLSGLTKNEQLYNVFRFEAAVQGSTEEWNMLSSKKVIFLLESVDTESEVVAARSSSHAANVRPSRGLTAGVARTQGSNLKQQPPTSIGVVAKIATSNSIHTDNEEEEDALTATATSRATPPTPRLEQAAKAVPKTRAPRATIVTEQLGWGNLFSCEDAKLDAIDLSSLLNVLDGAVEDPERIVVMIADHPERLDPALLRPGRLATHLRFDYIEMDALIDLCGLFYGSECLPFNGTLRSSTVAAATPVHAQSSGTVTYSRTTTDGEAVPLCFPHEAVDASAVKDQLAQRGPLVRADALLDWQRRELRSANVAKLEEQVIRQLSSSQAAQVRACVHALEQRSAAHSRGNGDHGAFNFLITPAHAHHLCMHAATLEGFLNSLSEYICAGVQKEK